MKASNQASLYAKGVWQLGAVGTSALDYRQLLAVVDVVDKAIKKARKV